MTPPIGSHSGASQKPRCWSVRDVDEHGADGPRRDRLAARVELLALLLLGERRRRHGGASAGGCGRGLRRLPNIRRCHHTMRGGAGAAAMADASDASMSVRQVR